MTDNDTSDEAFAKWCTYSSALCIDAAMYAWREAVRRCEARMEEREHKAFAQGIISIFKSMEDQGFGTPIEENLDKWIDKAYLEFREQQK